MNFLLMSENANGSEIEHSSDEHVGDGNVRQICCTRSKAQSMRRTAIDSAHPPIALLQSLIRNFLALSSR